MLLFTLTKKKKKNNNSKGHKKQSYICQNSLESNLNN